MSESNRLRLKDGRVLFQLAGECQELGHDAVAWRIISSLNSAE